MYSLISFRMQNYFVIQFFDYLCSRMKKRKMRFIWAMVGLLGLSLVSCDKVFDGILMM